MNNKILILLIMMLAIAVPASAVQSYSYTVGSDTVVIFNGTGTTTWTVPSEVTSIRYLVVAGGGSGGYTANSGAGGGGAGGMKAGIGLSVTPGSNIPITVGTGGALATSAQGNDGTGSSLGSLVTTTGGGGGGKAYLTSAGRNGGSGGGGGADSTNSGGSGISGEGNAGGNCPGSGIYGGSGGGGKSGAGSPGSTSGDGNGGAGAVDDITGSSVYYAGGGGGAGHSTYAAKGTGGIGGGGAGAFGWSPYYLQATPGTDGLGGGGGGGCGASGYQNGAKGGDGIVIIRYVTVESQLPITSFTGTPLSGTAPLTVQFTDTSSNTPTSWSWNFGDGFTSSLQNPTHTYNSSGSYSVTMIATNSGGSNTTIKSNYVTVQPPPSATSVITVGNASINQPGESTTIVLMMNSAPKGLAGYNFNVSFSDPSAVQVTGVTFPIWASAMNYHSTLPGGQNFLIKASDVNGFVEDDASNIELVTLTLLGLNTTFNSTVTISQANFDDDDGNDILYTVDDGNLEVDYPLTDPLIFDISPNHAYNNGSVTILLDGTGFTPDMIVKLTKPGEPDITSGSVTRLSRVQANCVFNLSGQSDGIWNITLTRTDLKTTAFLNNFTVVRPLIPVQGMTVLPVDGNNDGKYEDLNGNDHLDYADVNLFYQQLPWIITHEPAVSFDFDNSGSVGTNDIISLFEMVG